MIPAVLRQGLRLVEEHEHEVFRLVGGRDRHERREHPVLGIVAVDDLIGCACFPADVIARNVGELGGADLRVEAQEVAHGFADLRPHDTNGVLLAFRFASLQECRLHHHAAIDERADRHQCLQRRHVEPLAEGDRHRVELAPALRHERFGIFRQFGAQPIELAHSSQERLMAFNPDHECHARRADVGGVREDFRHRQNAMSRVKIVDSETTEAQGLPCINARAQRHLVELEGHGNRDRLEGRTHLVDADCQPVDMLRI